ncbi:hypothetical protein [Acuticoccus sp. I52.16.1]|uniref:hypothetical protein n=1 Tax=Acuticoccus sp. I52.16.1 TaxID=2928472 RepID=UPI001FD42888|nr:hypothetical protein [Acuticoccus sp. I52.16.1]UOM34486.1 hypothetical protein MRB58_22170 [Acuticoccus sp. I52.16.1]
MPVRGALVSTALSNGRVYRSGLVYVSAIGGGWIAVGARSIVKERREVLGGRVAAALGPPTGAALDLPGSMAPNGIDTGASRGDMERPPRQRFYWCCGK